ncbi:MAG: diguanylate cyclase [Nitrospirae bacterium]|nr:diguanylate cyclase [Nitrospirota bacterium]
MTAESDLGGSKTRPAAAGPLVFYLGRDQRVGDLLNGLGYRWAGQSPSEAGNPATVPGAADVLVVEPMEGHQEDLKTLRHFRVGGEMARLPMIVLTSERSPQYHARCLDMGADLVLLKPIHPVMFGAALRAALRRAKGGHEVSHPVSEPLAASEDHRETVVERGVEGVGVAQGAARPTPLEIAPERPEAGDAHPEEPSITERAAAFREHVHRADPRELRELFRKELPSALRSRLFSIFLRDPDSGQLELFVHNHSDLPDGLVLAPASAGLMVEALGRESTLLLRGARARRGGEIRPKYLHDEALLAPLKVAGEVVGVLNLANADEGKFEGVDVRATDAVEPAIAFAVSYSRLYEKVRSISTLDPGTGLLNHKQLFLRLHLELLRSLRYARPLSCVLLDIDYFKRVNDTYGHGVGEALLRELAGVVREAVREVDVVGRYGGEEFAAILPETTLEGASMLAERIRARVASHEFDAAGRRIRLTVSLGVASFPSSKIMHASQLVRHAERAMVEAKRRGRNRVYYYQERRSALRCRMTMGVRYGIPPEPSVRQAVLQDISVGGAALSVKEILEPGARVDLEIGPATGTGPTLLRADSRVVWCRPAGEDGSGYNAGVQFEGLPDETRGMLSRAVSRLLFRELYPGAQQAVSEH